MNTFFFKCKMFIYSMIKIINQFLKHDLKFMYFSSYFCRIFFITQVLSPQSQSLVFAPPCSKKLRDF